jgi:hypothetical protein
MREYIFVGIGAVFLIAMLIGGIWYKIERYQDCHTQHTFIYCAFDY